jgi:hypothetical protein
LKSLHAVGQFVVHPPSRIFAHPKERSFPDLYPLIRLYRRPLPLGRERILISGFIQSPPISAIYDLVHSLPLGVGRDFPFTED